MRVYSPADSADDAEECSKLHYIAEKDRLFEAVAVIAVLLFWGFVCVNLRDLRETFWGFICAILIEYSYVNILPQITQITQRRMQQAALYRRERQLGVVIVVLWLFEVCGFGFVVLEFVCVNQRNLRETLGFRLCGLFEYACVLFSRR